MKKHFGMLQWTEGTTGKDLIANTQRFEELGYDELWLPEAFGRETLSTCGFLLASTSRINVSSGIATVYGRDADAAAQAANGLAELSDGRFRLGLGVSHPVLVEPRGHTWIKPVPKMRAFLERLHEAPIESPLATEQSENRHCRPWARTPACGPRPRRWLIAVSATDRNGAHGARSARPG